jgi:hypothetical protein
MASLIVISGILGGGLLLLTAVLLVHLNWSAKIYGPVISILLIGTATTLATLFTLLKESQVESVMTTSVMLDSIDGAPPMFVGPGNTPVSDRHAELGKLGHPVIKNPTGGAPIITSRVNADNEAFAFCGELLQYYVLKTVERMQRGGSKFGFISGAAVATVQPALKVSLLEDHPGQDFLPIVALNRFSNSDMEQWSWQHGHMPLPKGTRLSLLHEAPTGGNVEKHTVRLEKPLFFTIDIVIEPLGGVNGAVPGGVELQPDVAARSKTYSYKVTMRALFNKITAGNWQTEEYKQWTDQLFAKLSESLRD